MSLFFFSFFIVLLMPLSGFSAELNVSGDETFKVKENKGKSEIAAPQVELLQDWEVAPAQNQVKDPPKRIYPGAFGLDFGPIVRSGEVENKFSYLLGLQYRHKSLTPGHWEGGAEIIGDRLGGVSFGYRYIFDRDERVRPQFKASLASSPLIDQGPADLFSLGNMSVRVALGADNAINEVLRFRFDGEAGFDNDFDLELRFRFGITLELEKHSWSRSDIKKPTHESWLFKEPNE